MLGHALYMKAVHGGKTKNDRIDAEKIAILLRGGMLPQAYAYPPEIRPTRDLPRRRSRLVRMRAELLGHVQLTRHQYNLAPFKRKLAYRAGRKDVGSFFSDTVVRHNVDVDIEVIDHLEETIKRLEAYLVRRTKVHDRQTFYRLRTVPGIGQVLAMTILYEVEDIGRFQRVQQFVSYARLVKGQKMSAGKRLGSQGGRMGNRHLRRWTIAVGLFLKPWSCSFARASGRGPTSPAWKRVTAKGKPSRYCRPSWDEPFTSSCADRRSSTKNDSSPRHRERRRRAGRITAAMWNDSRARCRVQRRVRPTPTTRRSSKPVGCGPLSGPIQAAKPAFENLPAEAAL